MGLVHPLLALRLSASSWLVFVYPLSVRRRIWLSAALIGAGIGYPRDDSRPVAGVFLNREPSRLAQVERMQIVGAQLFRKAIGAAGS
jgi:hypothetical protein